MNDAHSGKTIAQLRGMSDDDLVAAHDAIAGLSDSYSTADDYRAELDQARGQQANQRHVAPQLLDHRPGRLPTLASSRTRS